MFDNFFQSFNVASEHSTLNIFLQKKNSWNWVIWFHIGFLALAMQTYFHDFFFNCQFFLVKTGLPFRLCTRCLIKDIAAAAHWTIALAGEKINGWKTPFGVVRSCPDSLAPGLVLKRFHNHFDTTFFQSVIHLWETEMAMLAPMVHNDPKNIKNFRRQKLVKWHSRKIF